jgi:nitrate/nitrite transport system substrate-binding protein
MSMFDDPFDPDSRLTRGCECGHHASAAEHAAAAPSPTDPDALASRTVDAAVMRALIPHEPTRRRFLRAVGASTALAAISQFFPLGAARGAFAPGHGPI